MRIGIDARKLRDGGIGTYITGLLTGFAASPGGHRFVAFLDRADLGRVTRPGAPIEEVVVRARKYSLAEHLVLARAARSARVELFHAPHYTLPLLWGGAAVVTIHDLIHLRFPGFFPAGASWYARAVAGAATRRADLVLADSNHTRDEIRSLLDVPEDKIRVVPAGVSPAIRRQPADRVAAFARRRSLPVEYLLYVGARKRHKNLELLLAALGAIPSDARPPLVLSGRPWDPGDRLARAAGRAGVAAHVHFAGDLAGDEELSLLYSGASLYVQPSLEEGFGLPPLEAMSCGVPVLASNAGALPEVLGEAATLLAPRDPRAWAMAIAERLADRERREADIRRGLERSRKFTFARTASLTLEVYEEAATRAATRRRRRPGQRVR